MSLAGWGHTRGTVGACHRGRRLEGGCGAGVLDPTYLPPGPLLRREQQGVGERTRTGIRGAQSGEGSRALGAGRGPPLKATSCSVLALALPLRPPPRSGGLSPARSSGPGPGWARPVPSAAVSVQRVQLNPALRVADVGMGQTPCVRRKPRNGPGAGWPQRVSRGCEGQGGSVGRGMPSRFLWGRGGSPGPHFPLRSGPFPLPSSRRNVFLSLLG